MTDFQGFSFVPRQPDSVFSFRVSLFQQKLCKVDAQWMLPIDLYTEKYFECKWKEFEKGWGGLVFSKGQKTDLII